MSILDLYNLKEFDHEIVSQILTIYFNDVAKDIDTMREAVKKEDFKSIQHFSHKIVGASRTVGAIDVSKASEILENTAIKRGEISKIIVSLNNLESSFNDLKLHVKKNNLL